MRKKKVLVQGTAESLQKFFADAVSRDFETVALVSEENISSEIEVIAPQNLPKFIPNVVDAVILTDSTEKNVDINFFHSRGFKFRQIIFWNAKTGWDLFERKGVKTKRIIYFCGLVFHIRNVDDLKFFKRIHYRIQTNRKHRNMDSKLFQNVLAKSFKKRTGKPLDLKNPKTFTEKLQWIKIFDATPLKSRLTDKYAVRSWISEKIGDEYLIPLLGVWNDFDDINFDDLPDQFVLKCNHGSIMNIIVRDKKSLDVKNAREKINAWLAYDYGTWSSLELHYSRIERKIIAEKFMANGDLPDLIDYKFWCFDGKPIYCKCMTERTPDLKIDYFDMNWKHMDYEQNNHPNSDHPERILPPKNFELMKKLAAKLAEGFAFVRVDFYEIDDKVYFGEMTFTPGAGNFYYKSEGTDEYLGSLLKLPDPTPPPQL